MKTFPQEHVLQEHLLNLAKQIEVEDDQPKFLQLVAELNDLLDGKAHRLEQPPSAPNSNKSRCRQPGVDPQIVAIHCFMY